MFGFHDKQYRVTVSGDDWVTPEETLVDSGSDYSDLERPITEGVFSITLGIAALLMVVILFFAFRAGIVRHDFFSALALQNKTVNLAVTPPRGIILDRQGQPLVQNIPSFDIIAVSREFLSQTRERSEAVGAISRALHLSGEELINQLEESLKRNAVFLLASDVSKEEAIAVRQLNIPGIYVVTAIKRLYADGHQFSSVIGYIGRVNKADLVRDGYYFPSDTIGRLGIEASYEAVLRGEHGKIIFSQDREGSHQEEPRQGNNVALNIDSDVQRALYRVIYNVLREANLNAAAGIVQDPRNGAVLGLVSFPGFDNNIFSGKVSSVDFRRLFEAESRPLFNRVAGGLYNPGSTIKPFIGMTALQEKIMGPRDVIKDCISISIPNPFNPDEPYVFHNWKPETGLFNIRRAIANSCNIYFFTVGGGFGPLRGLGIERIAAYLQKAFADTILGVDVPSEASGFVPTPDWKKEAKNEDWYQGDTYNVSIGQGDLLVTPLWINGYISAIANGGSLFRPQVASRITDHNQQSIEVFQPEVLTHLPFDKGVIDEMKQAMRETVRSGTAKLLQDLPVSVGAKTGTAEVESSKTINALFTAFAPLDNAEISLTILIEGSPSNQGYAIRAAHDFLRWYFAR